MRHYNLGLYLVLVLSSFGTSAYSNTSNSSFFKRNMEVITQKTLAKIQEIHKDNFVSPLKLEMMSCESNVSDDFSIDNYISGTGNWASDWIEINNGGSATEPDGDDAGQIQIISNQLRIAGVSGANRYEIDSDGTIAAGIEADFGIESICQLTITNTYAENCTEPTANNFTADWKIGFETTMAPDNAISYQRNSDAVQAHTLTGTTDTLTITGIPADGGAFDTLKVWFTNDMTCADTMILKRPLCVKKSSMIIGHTKLTSKSSP